MFWNNESRDLMDFREETKIWIHFHPSCLKEVLSTWLSLLLLTLITWLGVVFVISPMQSCPPRPWLFNCFCYILFRRKSLSSAYAERIRSYILKMWIFKKNVQFKGYSPFKVITKYWLYSPCPLVHPLALHPKFVNSSL